MFRREFRERCFAIRGARVTVDRSSPPSSVEGSSIIRTSRSSLRPGIARILVLTLGASLAAGLLTATGSALAPAEPAAAATKAKFSAGSIITDPLFYDFGTMTATDIQRFLNKQVKKCSSKSQSTCLRDYKTTTHSIKGIPGRCDNSIVGSNGRKVSAAQIIYTVARACEVNPQVLLVTLQKEQGLVTAKSVATLKYRKAMGYGCPDTSSCDSAYYGFFNQVYWAARAFNAYSNYPSNFRFQPGVTLNIAYNKASSCGSKKDVYLQNRATAALYNYTPYTPNASSLAHPYKLGDKCSSYGNRNFWLYYNKWFGNSTLGQYFVKSGSDTYLVTEKTRTNTDDSNPQFLPGARWKVPAGSTRLPSTLAPLGSKAKVSSAYVKSLTNNGYLRPVVQVGTGSAAVYYLLAGQSRYPLANCAAVQSFGFDCTAPVLPSKIVTGYTLKNDLKTASTMLVGSTDGSRWVLGNGVRRELLATKAAADEGIALGTQVNLDATAISRIPVGDPIVGDDSLAINATTGEGYWRSADGTTSALVPASMFSSADAAGWFGGVDGKLSATSFARLPAATKVPGVFREGATTWLVTTRGRTALADPAEWKADAPFLDSQIATRITVSAGSLSAPAIVAAQGSSSTFLVADGTRRAIANSSDSKQIAASLGVSPTALKVPSATLSALSTGSAVLPPATIALSSASSQRWLIDGLGTRIAITGQDAAELSGTSTPRKVASSVLAGYATAAGPVLPGITCGDQKYLALVGTLRSISDADAAEYGSTLGFRSLDASTCAALAKGGSIGTFLKYSSSYFQVAGGTRRTLTAAQYQAALGDGLPAKTVSNYVLHLIPAVR